MKNIAETIAKIAFFRHSAPLDNMTVLAGPVASKETVLRRIFENTGNAPEGKISSSRYEVDFK